MITTKKELKFYIRADCMMNCGCFSFGSLEKIKNIVLPNYIIKYLKVLRKLEYYSNGKNSNLLFKVIYWKKFQRFGMKLGFSIPSGVFGYGLVLPHYGTIVVGGGNTIGNYAVLHTSTCITAGNKKIGDGLYLSTGAKVLNDITLNDNVSIGANSLVNKSFEEPNIMIAGCPAKKIKSTDPWYIRDGEEYMNRVRKVEELRESMGLA